MTERDAILILNAIPGLGNSRIKKLIDYCTTAKNVLTVKTAELLSRGLLSSKIAASIAQFKGDDFLRRELTLAAEKNIHVICFRDEDYPANLREIPDAPVILYVKGNLGPQNKLAVSLVGSRRASFYGMTFAEKLSQGLSELGVTVVSGLARGVDTAAHRGALKARGMTLAVLGSGLMRIYPPENLRLYEKIIEDGAIISEFPLETPPAAFNFPRRNRIISGLSLGVVVIEASERSGALITTRYALEQGREVFAVPGNVDHPNARGVNSLIKQGAKLVSGVEDVIEELMPQIEAHLKEYKISDQQTPLNIGNVPLTEQENAIYHMLGKDAVHVDALTVRSHVSASEIMAILLKLELKKYVKQLPGKFFIKAG